MKTPGFLARWRAFRRLWAGPSAPFIHRHDPALQRRLQRRAARSAFLSNQLPGQRLLTGPHFGDTQ